MYAIDRCHTRWFAPLVVVIACIGQVILAAPAVLEPTPLELKLLQSRKFLKPVRDVAKAIKTYSEDAGAHTCNARLDEDAPSARLTGQIACAFPPQIKAGVFSVKIKEKIIKIAGELVGDEAGTETTVRLRIYQQKKDGSIVQVTQPDVYSEAFSRIGEALFVAAIPIDAATQE